MKNKKATSVEKKKANTQIEVRSQSSSSKTKPSRRAVSQSQKIEEEFEEQLLDIDLKKPRRPFNFFIQEMFQKEGGKIDAKTMKDFSKKFKSISEKEKNRLNDLAEKDKERYEEHLNLVHNNLIKKPDTERKSGYHYFVDEQIGKAMEKGDDIADARAKAIDKWNGLSEEDKEKYYTMSDKNRDLYDKLKEYRSERISGYMLFSRDKRNTAKEKGETLTISELASMWKKSKDSVKEKYEEYAKELKDEMEKHKDLMELAFNLKPSRPLSAFNYFTKELYQSGDVKGFGKTKQISEKWEKLSDEEKEKYVRMAKKERLIYIIKKQNYDAYVRKDIGKAPSAMNIFFQDHAGEKLTLQDLYKKWKESSSEIKKRYQKKANEAKEEFQKKTVDVKNRVYEKPKRALAAYNFFFRHKYKELREQHNDAAPTEMFKIMSDAYKALSKKQLKVYEDMADTDSREKKELIRQYDTFGYYTLSVPKKRRSTTTSKRESVEQGDEPTQTKARKRTPSKSKKSKKN